MSHRHAPTELLRSGYAVMYRSIYTGYRCYQSITGARDGILRSTTTGIEIAFWPIAEDARAWLEAVGLREGAPVPVGIGHMLAWTYPFAHDQIDPAWDRGTLFEVPHGIRPRPAMIPVEPLIIPEPAPVIPRQPDPIPIPARASQALLF